MTIQEFLENNKLKYEALIDLFEQFDEETNTDDYVIDISYEN